MQLSDVKALVTGGSTGIGYEIASALIARGARVAISGRDEARLKQAAATRRRHGNPGRRERGSRRDPHGEPHHRGLRGLQRPGEQRGDRGVRPAAPDHRRRHASRVGGQRARCHHRGAGIGAVLRAEGIRRHHQHLVDIRIAGRGGQLAYASTKFALRGLSEVWRAELRTHNVRVMLLNPSEVITEFAQRAGHAQQDNPSKLRGADIAHAVVAMLSMEDRGFIPELSVWATNPR